MFLFSGMISGKTFAENLKLYYADIDSSEMALIHDNYQSAISFYVKAFQQKDKPFADDIYNLSVCYVKTGNLDKAMATCFELVNSGVGDKFFRDHSIFDTLHAMPEWPSLLENSAKVKAEFELKNAAINKKLNLLHQMTPEIEDSIIRLVNHQDSIYTTELLGILHENSGIVSAFELGASVGEQGEINFWPDYFIIILHNYEGLSLTHKENVVSPFDSLLKKAVFDGNIKPSVYAFLHDFAESDMYKRFCVSQLYWIVNDSLYINKFYANKDVRQKINRVRATIMLPSLQHDQQKQLYSMKEPNSPFQLYAPTNRIGNFKDKQTEAIFLKNMQLVVDNL